MPPLRPTPPRPLPGLLLALALCMGCGSDQVGPPAPAPEPAAIAESGTPTDLIILISLDTLRADHMSVYGYERSTSPELEDFAKAATVYTRCQTTAPWTLPSHASMFTGLYPFEHGVRTYPKEQVDQPRRFNNTIRLPERYVTLAEVLSDCGYRTGAVTANEGFLTEQYGLSQGFDHWDNRDARAPGINSRALNWLIDQPRDEPRFLFINYMDTHRPYNNAPRANIPHHEDHRIADLAAAVLGEGEYTEEQVQVLVDVYDTSVGNLDESLGEFFDQLRRLELFDQALIVITSDHGEFLGDHQLMDHAKDVYQGAAHVPLIVKAPGQTEPHVDNDWISLVHIPEIVLTHTRGCGIDSLNGRHRESVLTELFGPRPRQKLGAWRFKRVRRALMHGDFKFVDSSDGNDELYNLLADPEELCNLLEERSDLAQQLSALLDSQYGDIQIPVELNFVEMSDEDHETMRALGYAGDDEE
ncbi:MAG: arylsulfatase A-like enzyme [Chlamydiales bacterium]|jgi:arylsulfatase A-like enzyme